MSVFTVPHKIPLSLDVSQHALSQLVKKVLAVNGVLDRYPLELIDNPPAKLGDLVASINRAINALNDDVQKVQGNLADSRALAVLMASADIVSQRLEEFFGLWAKTTGAPKHIDLTAAPGTADYFAAAALLSQDDDMTDEIDMNHDWTDAVSGYGAWD
jgi:hypothetical protein